MILNKIKNFFLNNKKEILFFSFFIVLIFSIWDSFAEDAAKTAAANKEAMDSIIKWLNFFVKIFSSLLGIFSSLISLFLNPWWVNWTIFNLDIYMKDIWILVSNIVYFAFAFILIIIAVMNIFGKWGGSWELKSALPKFVIWLIMVPFTWFFVQFILSVSAILTISVLGLPYDIMSDKPIFDKVKNQKICTDYTFDLTVKTSDKKNTNDTTKQLEECTKWPQKTKENPDWTWMKLWDLLSWNTVSKSSASSVFGMINVYTYWIMKIQDIDKVTKNQLENLKSIFDIWLKLLFDLIFMIMFLLLMIALFLALFSRGIWLWLYTMLSPVFGLLFFFGKSKEWVNKISPVKFIELAMVPVYVAAALSFWMIFLFTATQWLTDTKWWKQILQDKWNWISELHLWDFTIKIKWTQWWDTNDKSIFNSLWSGIWQMIIEIFWLAILWIAVMAALNSADITKSAVEPIYNFGTKMWEMAMNAPKYAPIIPTPNWPTSASWMAAWMSTIQQTFQKYWQNSQNFLKNTPFWSQWEIVKEQNNLKNIINNYDNWNQQKAIEWLWKFLQTNYKDPNVLASSSETVNLIKDLAKKTWINENEIKKAKVSDTNSVFKLLAEMEKKYDNKNTWSYWNMFSRYDWMKNWSIPASANKIMEYIKNGSTSSSWTQNATTNAKTAAKTNEAVKNAADAAKDSKKAAETAEKITESKTSSTNKKTEK